MEHWAATWIKQLCVNDAHFLPHLIEQTPNYVHFLCMIRVALLKQRRDNEIFAEQAKWIRTHNKRDIMQQLYPACWRKVLTILSKLKMGNSRKSFSQSPDGYRQILGWLTDEDLYQSVLRKKRIKCDQVKVFVRMEEIPEKFRTERILNLISHEDDCDLIITMNELIHHFEVSITKEEINNAAKNLGNICDLPKRIKSKFKSVSFPPPPWQGNERIRPLCSRQEIKQAAGEFKNCLRDYVGEIMLGYQYFYICKQSSAVINVKKRHYLWLVCR